MFVTSLDQNAKSFNGDGTWSLTANNKAAGTSLTVKSDQGASETVPLNPI